MSNQLPENLWKDAKGRYIPEEMVKPIDKIRDELVKRLFEAAQSHHNTLKEFKDICFTEVSEFVDLSAKEYGTTFGGKKGNVTLYSFDGSIKIQIANHENIRFDERLQAAKCLMDECANDWVKGARPELVTFINDAFQVDKQGEISVGRILALRRHDIDDERWKRAMQAIADSVQVVGSKSYVRFYKRVAGSDQYQPLSLDIASI